MATIPTVTHGSLLNSARRTYIASRVYNNDFYTYTVTKESVANNFTRTGSLTPVTTDASKTPIGRTLRENGKKLYPGANPGITTYMVGVYDDQNGLSGYINPNSGVFAIYNTDKPTYLPDGSELAGGTFSGQNEGNSIYTRGDVVAGGFLASLYVDASAVGGSGGDKNFNVYVDPRKGNNFVANLTPTSAQTDAMVYLYFGTDATAPGITPADGEVISVVFNNSTGFTQTVVLNQLYSRVQGYGASTPIISIPDSTVRTLSFISDGSYLYLNQAGNIIASTGSFTVANTTNYYQYANPYTRFIVKDSSITATSKVFVQLTGFGTNNGIYSVEHVNDSGYTISGGVTAAGGFVITIQSGGPGTAALSQTFNYYVVN